MKISPIRDDLKQTQALAGVARVVPRLPPRQIVSTGNSY